MEKFKDKLRSLMVENNVSQEDLAVAVNVSQASISKYLKGSIPKSNISQAIASFFKVDHKWLASDAVDKTHLDYLERQRLLVSKAAEDIEALRLNPAQSEAVNKVVEKLSKALIESSQKNIECAQKNEFLRNQIVKENKFLL